MNRRIYVGYPTALEYWDAAEVIGGAYTIPCTMDALEGGVATLSALKRSCLWTDGWMGVLAKPLSVMVPERGKRGNARAMRASVWSRPLPPGAFRLLDSATAVATPEFCFLQAASSLGFVDLMQLGLEMCGTYSSGHDAQEELVNKEPRTTAESIQVFLSAAGQSRTVVRARRAAAYLIDGVASPMEAVVYLLTCLPYRRGGYGLEPPVANYCVDIPVELQRYTSKRYLCMDLCWPRKKVCLEYDSDEHHRGGVKAAEDSSRRDLLAAMGYRVHSLNMAQVRDAIKFDATMRLVAGELGKRLRDTPSASNCVAIMHARESLRDTLLNRSRSWKRGPEV